MRQPPSSFHSGGACLAAPCVPRSHRQAPLTDLQSAALTFVVVRFFSIDKHPIVRNIRACNTQIMRGAMISQTLETRIARLGSGVLRWSLVLFFVGFGLYKFTSQEAAGVAPLMEHSPVLFWVNPLLGLRGGSDLIGVIEITLGVMI